VEQREVACRRRAVWSGQRPAQALRVVAPRRRQAVPLGQALAPPPSVLAQAQVPAKRAVSGWSESRRRRGVVVGVVRPAPRVLAKRDPEAANLSAKAAAPLLSVRRSAASPSEEPAAGVGCASPREVAVVVAYALAPEPAVAAAVAQPDAVEQAVAAGEEPDAGPLPAAAAVPELLAAQAVEAAAQPSAVPVAVVAVQLSAGRAGAVEPPSAGLPAAPSSPSRRRPAQAPAPQPAACSLHVPQDLRIASRSARSLQAAEVEVCS
jgi:hypothetical protein